MDKSAFTHEYGLFLRLLREKRREVGISQAQLGDRLGQTQSWVSKCERGERRLDLLEARAFCAALGVGWLGFVEQLEGAITQATVRRTQVAEEVT